MCPWWQWAWNQGPELLLQQRVQVLPYLGDAAIGRNVNVGAGSITANFDGEKVNRTTVGDNCYIGSGAVLIAPLMLQAGAHVGAGMVVSQQDIDKPREESAKVKG